MILTDISNPYILPLQELTFFSNHAKTIYEGERTKASWIYRLLILSSFATFDLASTLLFLKHPAEEANMLAKSYLGTFGYPTGLILFNLLTTAFLVLILYFSNQTLERITGLTKLLGLVVLDSCLAWFVAGAHFVGGTSWFWEAPEMLRHLIGACLYLAPLITFQHVAISVNSKPTKNW